jgi:DNA processing protein
MLPVADENLFYHIALTFVKNIGPRRAKLLLQHFGNPIHIFKASLKQLKQVDGLGETVARSFKDEEILQKADKELQYVIKHGIGVVLAEQEEYPLRLRNCLDAPILLYYKGTAPLNSEKTIAVIGTRKYTDYGNRITEELIKDLQKVAGTTIISGLAHGIDAIAHKHSLLNGIPTIAVMGNGMDRIYPPENKNLAGEILSNGALLTEFPSGTKPDKSNFPMRNRIVAGMSDVTVVVESDIKGGALITARIASSYNRDVAAFPGRVHDSRSSGCNELIRTNIASMITGADDLLELMNWKESGKPKAVQKRLFIELSPEEQKIIDILSTKDTVHTDELLHETGLANSMLAATLLQLEMQDIIKALPGKRYRMN